jgi:hypothetical protein
MSEGTGNGTSRSNSAPARSCTPNLEDQDAWSEIEALRATPPLQGQAGQLGGKRPRRRGRRGRGLSKKALQAGGSPDP